MTDGELLGKLRSIRTRARAMLLLYGIGSLVAVTVAGFLLPVLADWILWLPGGLRAVLAVGLLAGLGYALWRFIYLPIRVRIGLPGVAFKIERRFPELDDRLASAVDFITHPNGQGPDASKVLIREAVRDAGEMTGRLRLKKALTAKATTVGVLAGLACGGIMLAMLAWDRDFLSTGLARLLRPLSSDCPRWPHSVAIEPISGDGVRATGQSFTVKTTILLESAGFPSADATKRQAVFVYYTWDSERNSDSVPEHRLPLAKLEPTTEGGGGRGEGSGQPALTVYALDTPFANLREGFSYRFVVDEGWYRLTDSQVSSRTFHVDVVPRPAVIETTLQVLPPAYMRVKGPPASQPGGASTPEWSAARTLGPGSSRLNILAGSRLRLDMKVNDRPLYCDQSGPVFMADYAPVTDGRVGKAESAARRLAAVEGQDRVFRFEGIVTGDFRLTPRLLDKDGLRNDSGESVIEYRVKAIADQCPQVTLLLHCFPLAFSQHCENASEGSPSVESLEVTEKAIVTAHVRAVDDWRVEAAQVELLWWFADQAAPGQPALDNQVSVIGLSARHVPTDSGGGSSGCGDVVVADHRLQISDMVDGPAGGSRKAGAGDTLLLQARAADNFYMYNEPADPGQLAHLAVSDVRRIRIVSEADMRRSILGLLAALPGQIQLIRKNEQAVYNQTADLLAGLSSRAALPPDIGDVNAFVQLSSRQAEIRGQAGRAGELLARAARLLAENKIDDPTLLDHVKRVGDGLKGVGESMKQAEAALGKASATLLSKNTAEPGQPGQPGSQGSRVNQPGQSGQTGQAGQSGQSGKSGESGQTGKSGESGQTGKSGEIGQTGKPRQSGQTGKSGQSGEAGKSGQSGQTGKSGESGQTGKSGESGEAGKPGQSGQTGKSGESGQTGKSGENGEAPESPPGAQGEPSKKPGQPAQPGQPAPGDPTQRPAATGPVTQPDGPQLAQVDQPAAPPKGPTGHPDESVPSGDRLPRPGEQDQPRQQGPQSPGLPGQPGQPGLLPAQGQGGQGQPPEPGIPSGELGKPSHGNGEPGKPAPPRPEHPGEQALAIQGIVIEQLLGIQEMVDHWGDLAELVHKLDQILSAEQLARRQAVELVPTTVGRTMDQLTTDQQAQLWQLNREQGGQASQTNWLINQMPRVAEAIAQTDPAGAKALAEAAGQGLRGQVVAHLSGASVQLSQARLADAIVEEADAIAVLQQMLKTLRDRGGLPEGGPAAKPVDLHKALEELIRRQEGHIQANQAAQAALANPPANDNPEFRHQAADQMATRVRADQVGKMLAGAGAPRAVPFVGEAVKAMDRAIDGLNLAGAAPAAAPAALVALAHQQAALQFLTDALEEVKKVESQIEFDVQNARRAKLRDKLLAIRDRQLAVNTATDAVAWQSPGAAKEEDLTRQDIATLKAALDQIAGEQAKVHTETSSIAKEVREASVVVGWLLDKALLSMDESRRGLAGISPASRKSHDLQPVRTEQRLAVRRLDEIIKALQDEMKRKRPDCKPGDGVPPLVSRQAELKLLRAMQLDLDQRIKDLDMRLSGLPGPPWGEAVRGQIKRLGDDQEQIRELTTRLMKPGAARVMPGRMHGG